MRSRSNKASGHITVPTITPRRPAKRAAPAPVPNSQKLRLRSRNSVGVSTSTSEMFERSRLRTCSRLASGLRHGATRSTRREGILPAAAGRGRARRKRRFEIIEHDLLLLGRQQRHLVLVVHPLQTIFPLPARHALLGDELEVVTRRAGIERVVAAGTGGKLLGVLRRAA